MEFSRDIVGIIAEYNPFHAGHLRHLQETRKRVGEEAVIVVAMSGYFTQRGEPAIWDKWLRARVAVDHGANLVVELPVYYALSAAQDFAYGGVKLLEALGAQYLSFGSEDADVARLQNFARKRKDAQFSAVLRHYLDRGESYPRAMELAGMPSTPNAILGVEYLSHATKLQPIVVERPQNHSSEVLGAVPTLSSARAMRTHLKKVREADGYQGNAWREGALREDALRSNTASMSGSRDELKHSTSDLCEIADAVSRVSGIDYSGYSLRSILTNDDFGRIVLAGIRTADPSSLAETRGAAEGIEHRLIAAAHRATIFDELVEGASSKRFTMARIRRILYSYLLGMKRSRLPELPKYARILGFDMVGQTLIRALRNFYKAPEFASRPFVLINKLSRDHLDDPFLDYDIKAAALYSAAHEEPTDEYSRLPYIQSSEQYCSHD